jgi:predicted DNA-binding protein (MmcQ/YjbR family)
MGTGDRPSPAAGGGDGPDDHPAPSAAADLEPLERLRAIAGLLPEVAEVDLLGDVAFRVAATTFALVDPGEHPPAAQLKLPTEVQARFLDRDGVTEPPDTGRHGWTRVTLDGRVSWDEIDDLVVLSYRMQAPEHLERVLDALLAAATEGP